MEGIDAELVAQVEAPDDVAVGFHQRNRRVFLADLILGFVGERAVIAVGLAIHVDTKDFAAVGDQVGALAIDGGRGAQAGGVVVGDFAGFELGDGELPDFGAGFFVEAEEDGVVILEAVVARRIVVGADENPAGGDDGVAVGVGAEASGPFDVFGLL